MLSSSRNWLWITYTDRSPIPPQTSDAACTVLRLVASATLGSANDTTKHVIE